MNSESGIVFKNSNTAVTETIILLRVFQMFSNRLIFERENETIFQNIVDFPLSFYKYLV